MAELDTSPAPWLQRAWSPRETFDPTPWLQERYRRQVEQAKLPLELQGMALQNKAHELMIEHQGIQQDLLNQELNDFQQDLPAYRSAVETAAKTPGGSIAMQTPTFRSKKAMDLWTERQKADAQTAYGQAIHQATIDDIKAVTEATRLTGDVLTPSANGQFDPAAKAALLEKANQIKLKQTIDTYKSEHPQLTKPQAVTVRDNEGNPITMVQTGPNEWRPVDETTTEITTPSGEKLSIKTGAKGGGGVNASGLNPAVNTELEKKIAASDLSLSLLSEALPLITPSNVGPIGMGKEFIEKVGNIVTPGSIPTTATEARQTFRTVAQQQYASLKADSQINKLEAAAMKDIVDITQLDESSPTAIAKYQKLRDLTALQNLLRHHQLNRIAPDNVLSAMSFEQIARSWKRGEATNAEVQRWNELHQLVK